MGPEPVLTVRIRGNDVSLPGIETGCVIFPGPSLVSIKTELSLYIPRHAAVNTIMYVAVHTDCDS